MKYFFIISLTLFSCSNTETNKDAKNEQFILTHKIDSLEQIGTNNSEGISKQDQDQLLSSLEEYASNFPKDDSLAFYLDKIQMIYAAKEDYIKSSEYAERIIKSHKNYPNRALIIESQAANYDVFLTPRDTNKIKHYYQLLLKENKNIDKEKREDILKRLKHIHLPLKEYIQFLNQ